MKIKRFETFRVAPRWLFLRIETDDGLVGWGEPVLEGHVPAVEAEVHALADRLMGKDPRLINDAWQTFYRAGCYRGGGVVMSAISGIDMALWDLLGRSLGVPVHTLLGGAQRSRVRSYCWIGGDIPTDLTSAADRVRRQGFDAVKFNVSGPMPMVASTRLIDEVVQRVASFRDHVGHDMDFALDFHGRIHAATSKVLLRELAPFKPMWVEDVVAADQLLASIEVARTSAIPVAIGERVTSRSEFTTLLESRAFDVINADPAHCGGITESIKIAAMAEAFDTAFTPHCPLGPIALATCLQIDAVAYNAAWQEQSTRMHYDGSVTLYDYLNSGLSFSDGFLEIPTKPGLGIDVNEDSVRAAAMRDSAWSVPVWRHADGSIAEW